MDAARAPGRSGRTLVLSLPQCGHVSTRVAASLRVGCASITASVIGLPHLVHLSSTTKFNGTRLPFALGEIRRSRAFPTNCEMVWTPCDGVSSNGIMLFCWTACLVPQRATRSRPSDLRTRPARRESLARAIGQNSPPRTGTAALAGTGGIRPPDPPASRPKTALDSVLEADALATPG